MTKISLLPLLLLLTVFGCHASVNPGKIEVSYSGYVFLVPQKASVIASIGGSDNILALRYGAEKGKRYLAFSEIKGDGAVDFGCAPSVFFGAVFAASADAGCNPDELSAFKKVFVEKQDAGKWAGDKLTVYFSIGKEQSFLFVFDGAGKAIKIDTDFLSKAELKDVVSRAL